MGKVRYLEAHLFSREIFSLPFRSVELKFGTILFDNEAVDSKDRQNLYRLCRIDHFYVSNGWRTRYMRIEYTTWIASLSNEGSTIWFILLYQLESDSDNERKRAEQSKSAAPYLSKTMLITHPVRKCVFEFLRVIMTDSLMSPSTAAKGQGVIDAILEVRNKIGISTKLP